MYMEAEKSKLFKHYKICGGMPLEKYKFCIENNKSPWYWCGLCIVLSKQMFCTISSSDTHCLFDMRHEKIDLKVGHCHTKRRVGWYDNDFSEFDSADTIDYILKKSVSYQKKDGRGHVRPSFFWHDNDKDLKVYFLVMHVI